MARTFKIANYLQSLADTGTVAVDCGISSANNKQYPGRDVTTASVATEHILGVVTKNIPQRDFMFKPFNSHREEYVDTIAQELQKDKPNIMTSLSTAGKRFVNEMKNCINSKGYGSWRPISEYTKRHKRNPAHAEDILIDTEQLINSLDSSKAYQCK